MKYINVFDNEAAYNAVKDSLARPQLAMEKSGGKIFNLSETVTPTIEYVDLGLSVKWAKYNLGATHGDASTSWYGNYYAWGETETKSDYSWDTYKWTNDSGTTMTKYNATDEKTTLESSDDIITTTYGGSWRMPTKAEYEALIALPNAWVTNYEGISGLNGRTFTGNGNTLFVPAAGFFDGSVLRRTGNNGELWTSSLYSDNSTIAWNLGCNSDGADVLYLHSRCGGLPVRGVCS